MPPAQRPIQVNPDTHAKVRRYAKATRLSMGAFVTQAVNEKIQRFTGYRGATCNCPCPLHGTPTHAPTPVKYS